nr:MULTISPECIES: transposase [Pseudofrankia]
MDQDSSAGHRSSTRSATRTATSSERFFNRLKQWRALATRYTKRAHYFYNEIIIASIFIWLR